MEDALVHNRANLEKEGFVGLNPCCNGRCTRTYYDSVFNSSFVTMS